MKRRITVADDDRQSGRLLCRILQSGGYEVVLASGLKELVPAVSAGLPDVLILDPQYPKKEGIELIRQFREWSDCPILAVSGVPSEQAATEILDAGADDFIRKPFYSRELLARVRAALRRREQMELLGGAGRASCYQNGSLTVDYEAHTASLSGQAVHLTRNEFRILALLCRYAGRVLTYHFIVNAIWGPQAVGENGALRVNIANLRKKIEPNRLNPVYLLTENGIGYRMAENLAVSEGS